MVIERFAVVPRPSLSRESGTLTRELEAAIISTLVDGAVFIPTSSPGRIRSLLAIKFSRQGYTLRSKLTEAEDSDQRGITVWLDGKRRSGGVRSTSGEVQGGVGGNEGDEPQGVNFLHRSREGK